MMKLLSKYTFAKHIQRQRLSEKKDFVWTTFDLSRLNRTVSKLFGANEIHGRLQNDHMIVTGDQEKLTFSKFLRACFYINAWLFED